MTVNQVMVPNQFFELYERCKRMHIAGINVTLKPQSNETASSVVEGYTDEMINIMQRGFPQQTSDGELLQVKLVDSDTKTWWLDQAERFNSFGFNNFNGWKCNSGYQSVIIRGSEVKRGYSCHDTPLGNILTGFDLFKYPVQCTTKSCVSSADSKIPKCK